MILSFDLSTSCVGFCLLCDDGTYSDIGYLELKKIKSFYEKLDLFKKLVYSMILYKEAPDGLKVFVEAPLQRSNNQNVVNLLQRFNGACCAIIYEQLKVEPILIEQRTALKTLGIKVPKGVKGKDRKKYILTYIQNLDIIPKGKWSLKRTGNPCDWCYDQSDAFIIAQAGLKHE